jgi:hypothetical protein
VESSQNLLEPIASSRYAGVSQGLIRQLREDYFAGRPPGASVPHLDPTMAAVIVAESLQADHMVETFPKRLAGKVRSPAPAEELGDWSRAAMAELFLEVSDLAREEGKTQQAQDWWALGWALLEEAAKSPTASPMLWYEDLFFDLAQELSRTGEREAVDFMKRGLAHNLRHNQGGAWRASSPAATIPAGAAAAKSINIATCGPIEASDLHQPPFHSLI